MVSGLMVVSRFWTLLEVLDRVRPPRLEVNAPEGFVSLFRRERDQHKPLAAFALQFDSVRAELGDQLTAFASSFAVDA